jgi:hypothetical protein
MADIHRSRSANAAAIAPDELEPALSRPYVDPPDGPRSGPLRMPRFTPRQPPTQDGAPPISRPDSAGPDAARPATPSAPAPSSPAPAPPPPAGVAPARHASRRPSWRPDPSVRAVIGDEIRIPIMWCQFGTCIARYTHRGALGERDLRARALTAGWRYDALGRLACPDCAQHDPAFWPTRAPAPFSRYRRWAG